MQAEILTVEQSYPLTGSGEPRNFILIKLPGGAVIHSEIDDDQVLLVFKEFAQQGGAIEVSVPQPKVKEEPVLVSNDQLHWIDLPDDILPPALKQMFQQIGAPQYMTREQIESLAEKVLAHHAAEEAKKAPKVTAPPSEKPKVAWSEVAPRRAVPRRTVPSDEYGNPVVQQRDPGEFVVDADEDGVGQL